jgi:hypothetical protein
LHATHGCGFVSLPVFLQAFDDFDDLSRLSFFDQLQDLVVVHFPLAILDLRDLLAKLVDDHLHHGLICFVAKRIYFLRF